MSAPSAGDSFAVCKSLRAASPAGPAPAISSVAARSSAATESALNAPLPANHCEPSRPSNSAAVFDMTDK